MTQLPSSSARHKATYWVSFFLVSLLLCRLALLVLAPHCDPSESRYAEIARKMAETGNWVTPQFSYGVPFWAKPPLSMWMSALGIQLFGANEFGSRIFIFLAALVVLALVAHMARREFRSTNMGLIAATLLMACPLFFYCSAAVMTDLALLLGTTLAMVSYRFALTEKSRMWGYAFFIGLAIGLLAKGPLALVIAGPPIFVSCLLTRQWRHVWKRIPWVSGTLLMLLLAVPWYVMAEKRTPGFIDYFIVGEHIRRFTITKWKGDLYGKAHSERLGMIWIYALIATFPWCLGLLAAPIRQWRNLKNWALADNGRGLYLALWALWPLVFFSPARNIIATYPLPALPAIVLLLTEICWRRSQQKTPRRFHPLHPALIATCTVITLWAITVSIILPQDSPKQSERELVKAYKERCKNEDNLLYFRDRKYSAEFYTDGRAETTESLDELLKRIEAPGRLFVATQPKYYKELPVLAQSHLILIGQWGPKSALYVERTDTPVMAGIDPAHTQPIGN